MNLQIRLDLEERQTPFILEWSPPDLDRLTRRARAVMQWCRLCHQRARGRRALRRMSDTILRDIGITRIEALREARKPFWKA
ncbi:MAG: hypothetical protein B0D96_13545 [Candidatus Sedimenticola endophacoides]|nr:MAG: hypothetical protein B0D94_10810 [Candidatus Sedimenticola endophacoides]OQX32512.1 MAG: hypothetical protein B0D96_13545 [Candidatus Sedimenticola endophacoides]OQX43057.1 MAG: hypothetical protein B0D89_00055 [Candidatus Sedimenticola endophacoides]OQX47537.1 MAG: hypothetical protein B0D85_01205 [Candidatus Sedimenticola endophacoides]OQX49320.1 MAG: hypothetical protein B0D87_00970 [Candidatus Sedimenticola endophacoides]